MHLSKIDYGHTRHCGDCKELACANKQRKGHFGKFELVFAHGASKILAPRTPRPPPPTSFKMLRRLSLSIRPSETDTQATTASDQQRSN